MKYWIAIVLALSALNLVADVSARAQRPWSAIAVNLVCGVAWAFLLSRPGASLSRMVSVYGVATYIVSVLAGVLLFGEALSWTSRVGLVAGLIAVVLLGI